MTELILYLFLSNCTGPDWFISWHWPDQTDIFTCGRPDTNPKTNTEYYWIVHWTIVNRLRVTLHKGHNTNSMKTSNLFFMSFVYLFCHGVIAFYEWSTCSIVNKCYSYFGVHEHLSTYLVVETTLCMSFASRASAHRWSLNIIYIGLVGRGPLVL